MTRHFAFLAAFLCAAGASAGLRLEFDVRDTSIRLPDVQASDTSTGAETRRNAGRWVVTMGADVVSVEKPSETVIRDFASRRTLTLIPARKRYREASLYAWIAYSSRELANRMDIAATLEAGGQPGVAGDRLDLEALFGVFARPESGGARQPRLDADRIGEGRWEFRNGRKGMVARYALAADAVPEAYRAGFRRFLAYECRVHPSVRDRLAGSGTSFSSLFFRTRNILEIREVELELRGTGSAPDPRTAIPAGWTADAATDEERRLNAVLDRARRAPAPDERKRREQVLAFVREAKAGKRYLDAFLGITEYGIETGESLREETREVLSLARSDPRVEVLAAALSPENAGEAKAGAAAIAGLDRKGLRKGHVLDIFISNNLATAGDPTAAALRMLSALEKNPRLAAGLSDLGWAYFGQYTRMPEAWACWDAARANAPGHPALERVAALEGELARTYPDFF